MKSTIRLSLALAMTVSGVCGDPAATPYTWRNVAIVAGGFITGIVMHPAENGLMYARTDIGGAYRWDAAQQRWIPLTDWVSPSNNNLLGVESIGLDPNHPERLYLALGTYTQSWAGTGAIARSNDRGATFQLSNLPIKLGGNEDGRFAGERLAVDPQNESRLYFGSRNDGLWTSTDQAASWKKVTAFPVTGATNGIGIVTVLFDTINPGSGSEVIYAAVSSGSNGIYRSTDSGATWQPVPGQPTGLLPNHLVEGPAGLLYVTYGNQPGPNGMSNGAVWKYDPKSAAWTEITPQKGQLNWGFGNVVVDAKNPNTVMVTTMDRWGPVDDVFRSTDGGATWKSVSAHSALDISLSPYLTFGGAQAKFGWWMGALAIDPFNSNHLLYGTGATIYATHDLTNTDSGATVHFSVGALGIEETAVQQLISPPAGPHLISGLGDIGGFAHDNLTDSPSAGMFTNPVFSTTSGLDYAENAPSIVARVGYANNQHGAYSTDGGHTWKPFKTEAAGAGTNPGSIAVSADGQTFVWSPGQGTLSYSRDSGVTWTASKGAPSRASVAADRANPNKFYVWDSSNGVVWVSTDGGANFSAAAHSLPHDSGVIRPVPGAEGDLWLAINSGLYHSTDSGATFARLSGVNQGVAVGFGKSATDGGYPALYLSGAANGPLSIYRSTDAGATWTRIADDAHQYGWIATVTGDPRIFGRVYIGSNGRGVIYGDDPAASHPKISSVVNGASFTAGMQGGAWFTILGDGLASTRRTWNNADFDKTALPVSLDGARVLVNGKAVPVYYISPGQINAVAPNVDADSTAEVVVDNQTSLSDAFAAQFQKVGPALFTFSPQNSRYAAAVGSDGSFVGPAGLFGTLLTTVPAKPGSVVQLFGTGCGPTNPPVDITHIYSGAANLTGSATVSVGGTSLTPQFAGITGVGLCQFNVAIPDVADGDQQVIVTVDGARSPDGVFLNIKR